MAEIIGGEFIRNETNEKSMGGTERLNLQLIEKLGKEELEEFQIVSSRVRELDPDKIRIFWAHDLPGDPESKFMLDKNELEKFHKYVFVSNWQMQAYIQQYAIPWSKCMVIQNAIDPIEKHTKPDVKDGINFIYHSTPHRGLNILAAVWEKLSDKYDNIHLDVYSSFELYGWEERDKQYQQVFEKLESLKNVTNHGTVPNEEIRTALQKSHIFAFPSIWPETSCLCLMEAMSAENICVHSNLAGLPETAANWNQMYQLHEDNGQHAAIFYNIIDNLLENIEGAQQRTGSVAAYANIFYGWEKRVLEWKALLHTLKNNIEDRSLPKPTFSYSTSA